MLNIVMFKKRDLFIIVLIGLLVAFAVFKQSADEEYQNTHSTDELESTQ